jgi:hypothetical protein
MGLLLDGIAASEHVDSSGEILSIDGCDISTLDKDGTLNFEHQNDDADDIVGKILYAKKIFSESDCENERQLYYFKKVRCPYIYIIGELFDEQGHPGSVAIAAMMRYAKAKNEPMMVGFSIEGSTLERDGMHLKRAVARRVAATLKPCNKSCISDMLDQIPDAKKALGADGFKPLSKAMETEFEEYTGPIRPDVDSILDSLVNCADMAKSLTAGQTTANPGSAVGGSALAAAEKDPSPQDLRNIIKERIRDKWDRITPIDDFLKSDLEDLGPKFKSHFKEVIEELKLRKSRNFFSDITTARHTLVSVPHSPEQKRLIAGLKVNAKDSTPVRSMNSSGNRVMVSRGHNSPDDTLTSSERAAAYHNLARDYFAMGDHVPMTTVFINPADKKIHHAVLAAPAALHGVHHKFAPHYDEAVKDLARDGKLHRIAIMDYVLGHGNRNMENMLIDVHGNPHLTDNEDAFKEPSMPEYWHLVDSTHQIVDMPTKNWADHLSPDALYAIARHNGLPDAHARQAADRLTRAKSILSSQSNIKELYDKE